MVYSKYLELFLGRIKYLQAYIKIENQAISRRGDFIFFETF